MAGHSQFKNIMHRKGRQDAQKSKLFGQGWAREITVAAKMGQPRSGDECAAARGRSFPPAQENMSKDSIEARPSRKPSAMRGEHYDEIRLRGLRPPAALP